MKALLLHFQSIDQKALKLGLGVVVGFYALLYLYIAMFSKDVLKELEKELASQVVPIETQKPQDNEHTDVIAHTELPLIIEGLYEANAAGGNLPIIRSSDKMTSFSAYKRPFALPADDRPVLSIIVADFGLSQEASRTAVDILPPEVGFALSPETKQAPEWAKILRQAGREFWIEIPYHTQGENLGDPGPAALYASASASQNQKTLHNALGPIPAAVGIASSMPKNIESNLHPFRKVTEEVFGRGLGYLELNPAAGNELANIALAQNAPYVKADTELLFLPEQNPFIALEGILKTQGYALAVVAGYPKNIQRVAEWLIKIGKADYVLAPPSAIYDLPLLLAERERTAGNLRNIDKVEPPSQHPTPPALSPTSEVSHETSH